jgi:importin subunit alpha-6/7
VKDNPLLDDDPVFYLDVIVFLAYFTMDERQAARRKEFKKGTDAEETRRRREDEAIQIRKKERDEQLARRRKMQDDDTAPAATPSAPVNLPAIGSVDISVLPQLLNAMAEGDVQMKFRATQQVRKLLSIEKTPPIQPVIEIGMVPYLVQFIQQEQMPDLQFEAAWALTNIASGNADQTKCVVDAGTVPLFIRMLASPNGDVKEQAVWALGNIAGDSPALRDLCLKHGVMVSLLDVFRTSDKASILRNATWCLSNLCRGKPQPRLADIEMALPVLANLIHSTDNEVVTDALWALSYISDGPNDRIEKVIEAGVCRRLTDLLGHQNSLIVTPALRTVGNIVTGDDRQTQVVIQSGALTKLLSLLYHPRRNIRKETCWTISNITAGSPGQIQQVIEVGLFPKIVETIETASEYDVRKEAAWAISNATSGGTPQQIDAIVQAGAIKPLCDLLAVNDSKLIGICLEALDHVLAVGKAAAEQIADINENPYLRLVEEADGLSKIEALQHDTSDEIYRKAVHLLETYFPVEEEDIGGGGMDSGQTALPQGGFHFGN